jgi:hypothetical protein
MKKEVKITVPTKWSAVTLKQYLALQRDLKVYGEDENAYVACLLHHLCGFSPEYLHGLDTETFIKIKKDLTGFMSNTDNELQRFIKIDGVEYGFEPNLSKMSYGSYLDITKHDTFTIDDNWAKIMSILYRPVKRKGMGTYEIEEYNGKDNEALFLDVSMDIHYGALFFFVRLLTDLPSVILKSMMDSVTLPQNIRSVLERSGKITAQLSNSQEEI